MRTIICVPGLGGRENLFSKYKDLLPDFKLETLDVINWPEAQENIYRLVEKNDQVIFLCSCYGFQLALRAVERFPSKVTNIIVVEAFFGEFLSWNKLAYGLNAVVLGLIKVFHGVGIKRKKFPFVDYNFVEKQPLFIQPYYDIKHQGSYYYFQKIKDIITYKLPKAVETKVLFIFSPGGFMQDAKKRARLKKIFPNSSFVELGESTHNIMTLSSVEIGEAIKNWLK